jgi:ubiquinone/menaquinone biosynthesis C-methylase UbiE
LSKILAIEYDYVTSLREEVDKCLIEHLPDRKKRALDIGCGGGNNSIFLSELFQSVIGIDISDSFLKIAQRKVDEKRISNI